MLFTSGLFLVFLLFCAGLNSGLSRLMFDELNISIAHASHYSQLMNNQHIVMVGDSLMRYQYVSLVYLVHTNKFYPADSKPNLLWEGDYGNWNEYFEVINTALHPNEYCDCYRVSKMVANENRYYYHEERNISISYIAYFGDMDDQKVHGHWSPLDNETNHQFHAPTHGDFIPYRWEADSIQEALFDHVAKLKPKPSVLVLNCGFWRGLYSQENFRKSVLNLALSLFDRVIWKTTNYDWNHDVRPTFGICQYPGIECLNLDWTEHLQKSQYRDTLHLYPDIYTDINIQFILQLVHKDAKSTYVPMAVGSVGSIVHYKDKHYLVDQQGLLRPFTPPMKSDTACTAQLRNHTHVFLSMATLRKHILGPSLPNICA